MCTCAKYVFIEWAISIILRVYAAALGIKANANSSNYYHKDTLSQATCPSLNHSRHIADACTGDV